MNLPKLATIVGCFLLLIPVAAQSPEQNIADILASMSLRQKVSQMFVATFFGSPLNAPARDFLQSYQPGAVALLPSNLGNPQQIAQLTNDIQQTVIDAGGIPLFIAVDQEGGIIAHLDDGFTRWPVPMLLTATADTQLAYSVGVAFAEEMLAVGINMNLAPVADLYTNPDNPIIGRRSFGSFPAQVSPILATFTQGMQSGGVLATAKHFPGHGDTSTDSHVTLPIVPYDLERLTAVELAPFMGLIDAEVGAIMTAHIWLPQLEPEADMPASLSQAIVTGILREQLAYDGLIMTDALDMDAIDTVYSPEESALMAIQAGNDMVITGAHISPEAQARSIEGVVAAVEQGQLEVAQIDASVMRILRAKQIAGVLDWSPIDVFSLSETVNTEAHNALITTMFERGITVGYGDDQLPIAPNTLLIYPASQPSLWRACAEYGDYQPLGISDRPTVAESEWARSAASAAEQIVIFTRNLAQNAPLLDLVMGLPAEKTTVVALHSPEDWRLLPDVASYIMTYSPLRATYEPVCAILSGNSSANGRIVINMSDSP